MPKSAYYTLTWSPTRQVYELYEGQEDEEVLEQVSESSARLAWACQISSFAFHGKHGSYTARKEHKQRGNGYWYAYVRVGGKLTKKYLGRGSDLTLTHLERVAQQLWLNPQTALWQQEERASSRPRPSFPPIPALSGLSAGPLLATKLQVPRPRPHQVRRTHLFQRLQQGMERTLTLISAPAGFGKSTLLSDWLTSRAIPTAWFLLEPQDNEPIRFLSYLIAALQTYDPQVGTTALALLHTLQPPPMETVLTLLINDLLNRGIGEWERFVLVLDDYQVINAESIHHAIAFLLDHLPPQMHLVLATREDPPLPLAHLRGRDDLLELRLADLRFTQEETATYLVEIMGLSLSVDEIAHLQGRTEGWITGLHLAALSLQGRDDQTDFITAFTGSHHYVADYLLDEVLNRQDEAVQDFLLQTCILDRLSAPLCDAVRTQNGSQALLDYLERANLFLVPLDDERKWYRYHRLFAEVLRHRLQQTAPTVVPDLHRRASRWYEQHEFFGEAVSHALAAPALHEVVRLIEQRAWIFIISSQMQTLCSWLQALPESLVLAHPLLSLISAIVLMYTNRPEEATARLQTVERELSRRGDPSRSPWPLAPALVPDGTSLGFLPGQVAACWSLLARLSGDLERCVAFSQQALDLLPETGTAPFMCMLRVGAMFSAIHAYLVSGDVTNASERLLSETVIFTRTSSNYRLLTPKGLTLLARLQALQGRLHQAAATYEEVVQIVPRPGDYPVLANGPTYYFGLGDLLREWNELDAAEHYLLRGIDLIRGTLSVDADDIWMGYAALARLQQARGRYEQAVATLDTFMQVAHQRHVVPLLMAQCAALRAHMELVQGHLQAARYWADTSNLSATDIPSYPREREYLSLARVRIALERVIPTGSCLSEVRFLLERLLLEAEANRRMHSVLEVLLLYALALQVQGNHTGALTALGRALTMAEPEGYLRLFLDEGPPMAALLQKAQRHGLAPRYTAKLLLAMNEAGAPGGQRYASHASTLIEPLTARERDVLWLVLDGASNREIARQLFVSVNTVKKHILNIYGKLNVQSRAQASAKARTLYLL
jgi:LuxR family transcriptional regulator, maltose regulon positive regulatory protein